MSVLDDFKLDGDVALVTGAAGGIGGAFTEAMAEAGADVVAADIDATGVQDRAERISEATGANVRAVEADVTEMAEVEAMVRTAVDEFGGLDVAFANAGVSTFGGGVDSYDMEAWADLIDVNLTGVMRTCKAAVNAMADGGRIVNTASILGLNGTQVPGLAAYCASKGGVIQLTRQMAAEFGTDGIRVNAIAPGWIESGMTEMFMGNDAITEELLKMMAIKRFGDPADLKGTALYLASEASPYTTGEVVLVDGGMNAFH
ncbi:SDR family NAD(P)-dependent oxidoreductase [Halorientalis litorea]|uniref:SDR family NAD(P)-dependent oxidoreductase n=1 Tax=Halorientalis litorea TaxID=2931977 RepID=UPI001FF0F35E|nr:SDR family oxidoreductase [Halorientalis litorea]